MKTVRALAASLVLLPLLVACSTGGDSVESAKSSATSRPALPGERESFGGLLAATDETGRVLRMAEGKKTAECMKERGFRYTPYEPRDTQEPAVRPGDVEGARKYGYGQTPRLKQALEQGRDIAGTERDPDFAGLDKAQVREWARALGGPAPNDPDFAEGRVSVEGKSFNKNGCVAMAQEAVRADNVAYMQAEMRVESLTGEVWSRVLADPEWAAAQKGWSTCMKKRGYSYSNGDDASEDILRRVRESLKSKSGDPDKLEKLEIDTAVADAECIVSTKFRETQDALVERHEKAVTAAHEGDIAAFTELRQEAVKRATEILK